jgi:cytochrome c biogenesis factor
MRSKSGQRSFEPVEIEELNLRIQMTDLDASGTINLQLSDLNQDNRDESVAETPLPSLTIDASIKPFIGFVWLGTLVMTLGFVVSVVRRTKEAKT